MITSDNIKVLVDFEKFGISSSEVLFHIIELPKHGELSFGSNIKKRKVFSLAQLTSNKIVYIHDGSETVGDTLVLEIEIDSDGAVSELPPLLTMRQRYLFEIRVLPVNDVPVLRGSNEVLRMAAGSKMQLPAKFIQVIVFPIKRMPFIQFIFTVVLCIAGVQTGVLENHISTLEYFI